MPDIFLTDGDDRFQHMSPQADTIYGLDGHDTIYAGDGDDVIYGGDGSDMLFGEGGSDTLYGGEGNDFLSGEHMEGGAGNDRYAINDNASSNVAIELYDNGTDTIELYPVSENLLFQIPDNIERLFVYSNDVSFATIYGSYDNNYIFIGDGDSYLGFSTEIHGMDGDDTIIGQSLWRPSTNYVMKLFGGNGNDYLLGQWVSGSIFDGGEGIDTLSTKPFQNDTAIDLRDENRYVSIENIIVNRPYQDLHIYGTDQGNEISIDSLYDVSVSANGGDDKIFVTLDAVHIGLIDGGSGYDTLQFDPHRRNVVFTMSVDDDGHGAISIERLVGTATDDTFTGNLEDNRIDGRGGNDTIQGREGSDTLFGDAGDDSLYGNDGDDTLRGGNGNDWLSGGRGVNVLHGEGGNDSFIANLGTDTMHGGTGNDVYTISIGGTTIVELAGEGTDQVFTFVDMILADNVERLTSKGLGLSLTGNALGNLIFGDAGANMILGGGGDDRLRGGNGDDTVRGEAGNDNVWGDAGADTVRGGAGNDILVGGTGLDSYQGGLGRDSFRFDSAGETGSTRALADVIVDFSQTEQDRIILANIDADTLTAGNQTFSFIGAAAFGGMAGQLRAFNLDGNTYVTGDTNGDSVGDFYIRLDGLHTLIAADFIL